MSVRTAKLAGLWTVLLALGACAEEGVDAPKRQNREARELGEERDQGSRAGGEGDDGLATVVSSRSTGDSSTSNAAVKTASKATQRQASDPAKSAAAVLREHCAACHAIDAGSGQLGDVLDLHGLVEHDFVVPGLPKQSLLLQRIERGEMPPAKKLPEAAIAAIRKWIKLGALSEERASDHAFVEESDIHREAAEDLLGNFGASDRVNIRYLTVAHLYNANVGDEVVAAAGQGISKLVNGLSWKDEVAPATAIGDRKLLYRIDLRDYGWNATTWDELVRTYAYLVVPKDAKALAILQSDTKTPVPMIRGDWFLFHASRAPLYYRLLGMPQTIEELEVRLGTSFDANIAAKAVMRAGFSKSAVSPQNRVIERHATDRGFVWRSYEFGTSDNAKSQDVFTKPLGPAVGSRKSDGKGGKPGSGVPGPAPLGSRFAFRENGGEFIFSLPNGMLAFFLAAASNRQRLDAVPVDEGEAEIVPGTSCMACHGRGLIEKDDMVRARARGNAALAADLPTIEALYRDQSEFNRQIADDTAAFQEALRKAGVEPKQKDPVFRVARSFALNLSVAQAAAELGVKRGTLELVLERSTSPDAAAFQANSISRADFEARFQSLSESLRDAP